MRANRELWRPDWATPPGEILAEALDERGMTQVELARRIGRPLKTVNEIAKGKAAITPETALQLEFALGIAARFWLDLEREYGEQLARKHAREEFSLSAAWAKRFPLRDLAKREWIAPAKSTVDQTEQLLKFFGVTSAEAWQRQWETVAASFRRPKRLKSSPEALASWLRGGERLAADTKWPPFDAARLAAAVPKIRALTRLQPIAFEDQLIDLLGKCGVALVLVREFEGTHLYGASYWISPQRAVIQLSLRQRMDDQFWFSVFHEIDHLLRGSRRRYYVHGQGDEPGDELEEKRADAFAARVLIPEDDLAAFEKQGDLSDAAIEAFARSIGVSAGIVVGQLQRHGLPRNRNSLKRAIRFRDD